MTAVGVEQVPESQWRVALQDPGLCATDAGTHPSVLADVPTRRIAGIPRMIEVGDPLGFVPRYWPAVVDPATGVAEDLFFVHAAFAVGQGAATEVFGDVGGDSDSNN